MFDFITDSIENVLDVGDALVSGENISKRQVTRLISDGLSVAAIASAAGVATSVIEKMLED